MIHTVLKNDDTAKVENISDPSTYYALVDIIKSVSDDEKARLEQIILAIAKERDSVSRLAKDLLAVANQFHEEAIHSRKRNTGIMGQMDAGDDEEDTYRFQDHNYIILMASVIHSLSSAYGMFYDFAMDLRVPKIITVKERVSDEPNTFEEFNGIFQEMQFNGHTVKGYANNLAALFNSFDAPGGIAKQLYQQLEPFYKYLLHTHQKEGVKIITNPVVTNVAMHIFENIDSHGEIKKDGESTQVSAYTLRKAETLAQALVNPTVQEFLKDSDKLQYLVRVAITDLSKIVVDLNDIFAAHEPKLRNVTSNLRPDWMGRDALPQQTLSQIDSIKFSTIVYNQPIQEKTGKLAAKMRDETIEKIASMITQKDIDFTNIVEYVMARKAELNKFFFEENSFYVCKIGEGNPFLGQAPGALYVEPAERPRGKLKDILGSGFPEIKDFAGSIESSSKFHDLFVATSPSKSADKSNVLMVGPMGCGKALPVTEPVLTPNGWVPIGDIKYGDFVIGSDGKPKEVIGVYPQGSREIVTINFTDDAKSRCDLEHLWTVKSGYKNAWHTVTAKQMMDGSMLEIPANKSNAKRKWSAALHRANGTKRLYIPIVDPIEFQWKDLSIDPYTLGAWLGDGHSNQGIICGVEEEVFEEVGKKYTQGFKNFESRGYNGLLIQLRELDMLDNKHIPNEYLTASVEQRMELLRGLMDTDGNAGNIARRTTFANSNERLVDDVVSLVRSLGGIAKKGNSRLPKYTYKGEQKVGKPAWQVGIKLPDALCAPFKMTRKVNEFVAPSKYKVNRMIKSIESFGEYEDCVCIKVDAVDSLFVTRDYILTHNTEVLRAIGADKGSIGIFAQGSDFLTCWKGEAEKNPKRLFQEGLKLARESGRHVHFLIDEIDSLLNNDRDISGNNNLTLEFQILMDGVVSYPNLSVWGATNHVERIPMPMIRRFNKVLVVGELSRSDRADLLKMFTSYMPITAKVKDRDWENWAVKLEGATGDVIRKIADHIWRDKVTAFVNDRPEKAEEMVEFLNRNGKFNVDEFNKEQRAEFKHELSKYMVVTTDDMDRSIESNLKNLGIKSEIETAVATYRHSRAYLESADSGEPACKVK